MSWVSAIKEWNAGRDKWSLPKKDTPEYTEVKKIQDRLKASKADSKPEPKNEIVEEKSKPVRKSLAAKKEPKHPRREKQEKETPETKPVPVDESKTRTVSKTSTIRTIVDLSAPKPVATPIPIAPKKESAEPLKAKSKDEKQELKDKKKQTKLQIIEKRGELAKAKLEKNMDSVAELTKHIKDLKISLL